MAGDITTIARPYAEAVFAKAQESGEMQSWSDALETLAAIANDPDMQEQIGNPNVPRQRLAQAILSVAEGAQLAPQVKNLVSLLAANKRLSALPEVARLFEELKTRHQGVREVQVISAFDLDEKAQQDLAAALKKRFGAEVQMTVETDPSLIGGVEVRSGDLVIDGSVRGKLHKLASELQF